MHGSIQCTIHVFHSYTIWASVGWDIILHYIDVIMSMMASQITQPTVYSGTHQRKHQSSTSLAFVRGIHRWPVNYPHKVPVTQKMFPFDDVNMTQVSLYLIVFRRSKALETSDNNVANIIKKTVFVEMGSCNGLMTILSPQLRFPLYTEKIVSLYWTQLNYNGVLWLPI